MAPGGQTEQAWCLALVTNAVVTWTTEYCGLAVEQMRAAGRRIADEILARVFPANSENTNLFGAIEVDIEGELAQLGPPAIGRYVCETRCSDGGVRQLPGWRPIADPASRTVPRCWPGET